MSEWFDYSIKFANKEENLAKALVENGFANFTENKSSISIDLKKIDPVAFATGYCPGDNLDHVIMGFYENSIFYTNKGSSYDTFATSVSKCFPNDVFEIFREYDGGYADDMGWYEKNGQITLKDGTPVIETICRISPRLLKDKGDFFQVSLPIGEENDRWGIITMPKRNVKCLVTTYEDNPVLYGASLFFDTEYVNVSFKTGTVRMSTREIVEKYYKSRREYRKDMQSTVEIAGLHGTDFSRRENGNVYYVVSIPCPLDVSATGYLSITLPESDVCTEQGRITLGEKGKYRNVQTKAPSGEIVRTRMSNFLIKEYYEKTLTNQRMETEEEQER